MSETVYPAMGEYDFLEVFERPDGGYFCPHRICPTPQEGDMCHACRQGPDLSSPACGGQACGKPSCEIGQLWADRLRCARQKLSISRAKSFAEENDR